MKVIFIFLEQDFKQKNLIPVIGDKSTVSRILNGERKLGYDVIGTLSDILKITVLSILISNCVFFKTKVEFFFCLSVT